MEKMNTIEKVAAGLFILGAVTYCLSTFHTISYLDAHEGSTLIDMKQDADFSQSILEWGHSELSQFNLLMTIQLFALGVPVAVFGMAYRAWLKK